MKNKWHNVKSKNLNYLNLKNIKVNDINIKSKNLNDLNVKSINVKNNLNEYKLKGYKKRD